MKKRELLYQIEATRQALEFSLRENDHELQIRLQRVLIELHDSLMVLIYEEERELTKNKKGA